MRIVLLRHAECDLTYDQMDPELNARGQTQAAALTGVFAGYPRESIQLWSSPKQRTRQTLQALSQAWAIETRIVPELDERSLSESKTVFEQRVQAGVDQLTAIAAQNPTNQNCLILCSHADWLACAISRIPSNLPDPDQHSHLGYGQFVTFHLERGVWRFEVPGKTK